MSESILEEAQRIIHGDRNIAYGHPRDNFAAIAAVWDAYLQHKNTDHVTSQDVANMMILMKVARVNGGSYHRDSYTDIAGYAGTAERLQEPVEDDDPGHKWLRGEPGVYTIDTRKPGVAEWEKALLHDYGEELEDEYFEARGGDQNANNLRQLAGDPRQWDSLAEVPVDVQVVDPDGDIWTYYNGRETGWGYTGRPAKYSIDVYEGPFVERLDG